MILYLLPFKNGRHFKYGVTDHEKRGFDRSYFELDQAYKIDFAKALMITANKKKEVSILENEIRRNYSRYFRTDEYTGKTGSSEILPIEYFESVLSFINQKAQLITWQGLKIEKHPEPIILERKPPIKQPKAAKPEMPPKYSETLRAIDFLCHPYGKELITMGRKKAKEVRLYENQMPGIFKFIQAFFLTKRVSIRIRGGFSSHDYIDGGVTFYFENKSEKVFVELKLHDNFLADADKSEDARLWNLDSSQMEGEPIPVEIDKLEEVYPLTDDEIEYWRMTELANQKMLDEQCKLWNEEFF